ncbi:hypothetical protein F6W70_15810 [Microbacterium maritypicum]|uniref:DUF2188 domain-containing protein n=1 Tax=Microbacterium maritypicum TaxID=33918 RepID=A0AAD3ZXK6_MICMQ|nr:hypothetical protein [Microbacterium liquefaciens]KAB1881347.1 hypothetical protein F6W70_15810 [Microbacterium liquefaciens]
MAAGDIETFHRNGIWFNRIEGESQTLGSSFMSEAEAVKVGRSAAVARQVEHTVRSDEGPSVDSFSFDLHPRELIGR